MLKILSLTICSNFILIQCTVSDLTVRHLDPKLIERKRQDTLEMCRIFNDVQLNRLEDQVYRMARSSHHKNNKVKDDVIYYRRSKRDIYDEPYDESVESIVDQSYDENHVYYRHPVEKKSRPNKKSMEKPSRRYNFAPAFMAGPEESDENPATPAYPDDNTTRRFDWPKKWQQGIIPYFIDSRTYDEQLAEAMIEAFDYIERMTCIRLQRLREKPRDVKSLQDVEWLYIANPQGYRQCVHSNERTQNKGVQMIIFGYDCMSKGEIVHEIMHVLGFSHEHTRPDRDRFVTVLWDNIKPGYKKYFNLRREDIVFDLPYDYSSIMHYPQRAFSKNGQITILAQTGVKIGQRKGFSDTDINKIGLIYGSDCLERNKKYLEETCSKVINTDVEAHAKASKEQIQEYFKKRIWPMAHIFYKFKDALYFTTEEKDNIHAVIRHIQKETCIEFEDISPKTIAIEQAADESERKHKETENLRHGRKNHTDLHLETQIDKRKAKIKSYSNNKHIFHGNFDSPSEKRQENHMNFSHHLETSRRHQGSRFPVLTLRRSENRTKCECPKPGRPDTDSLLLELGSDCFNSVNDLLHVFVHVLGLDHQHNSHDRDDYLHVNWDKLTPDVKREMEPPLLPPAASVGFPYDYQSVMHYPWLQINDGVTNIMYPIWNDGWAMGHWQGLSSTDVQKLKKLYEPECEERRKLLESQK